MDIGEALTALVVGSVVLFIVARIVISLKRRRDRQPSTGGGSGPSKGPRPNKK